MTAVLGFLLECAAVAALAGTAAALLVLGALLAVPSPVARLSAAARADVYLIAGFLPAMAAISTLVAAAAPSIATSLGFGPDHCAGHSHHFHICFLHASELRPPLLAALGALALMSWTYRAGALIAGTVASHQGADRLERLGTRRQGPFPVTLLPGALLCHSTGIVRRRILLSLEVVSALSPQELNSAVAHEEAHLRRRDPLANFLLAVGGLFIPPPFSAWIRKQQRRASEEVCDAAAAAAVGDGTTVASALVKVAALQRRAGTGPMEGLAFGEHQLEARVELLLGERRLTYVSSRWCLLAVAAAVGFAALTLRNVDQLHHAAETLLGRLF